MTSLVAAWPIAFEAALAVEHNAEGMLQVGVGYDVFMLCPEQTLKTFEESAALANPIAAYNAALMHLERGNPGDIEAAETLLKQSASAGDKRAQAKLQALGH